MKRTKLLALTLVVAIMLVGAGYALWSDQLVIASTVQTGHLDVDFTKVEKVTGFGFATSPNVEVGYDITNDNEWTYGDYDAAKTGPLGNNDKVNLTITKFYPGARATAQFTIKNEGTVPVKIDSKDIKIINDTVDVPTTMRAALDEYVEENIEISVTSEEVNMEGSVGTQSIIDEIASWAYYLEPEDTKTFYISFKLDSKAGNSTEMKTFNYTVELDFNQSL